MMQRVAFLSAILALTACSGSSSRAPFALSEATSLIAMLQDPDDIVEIADIQRDFAGIELTRIGASSFFRLEVPAGTDLDALARDMKSDLRIIDTQPNYLAESPEGGPGTVVTFGDDLLAAIATQVSLDSMHVLEGQALARGNGIVVAVIDTGLDLAHPFLTGRIAAGGYDFVDGDATPLDEPDFVDNDGDGEIDEQYGHGTFIASLVLAVAPDARILPLRVLDADGFGTASMLASGIIWAADAGAHVINVSADMPLKANVVEDAIRHAQSQGAIVVAAAGNGGLDRLQFPARFGEVLSVGAVTATGIAAPFTNHGNRVSVVAPGVDLIGAYPESVSLSGTARWSGTSFAAPLVAGVAALARSAAPALDGSTIVGHLQATAVSVDFLNPGLTRQLGTGLIDARAAVEAAMADPQQ